VITVLAVPVIMVVATTTVVSPMAVVVVLAVPVSLVHFPPFAVVVVMRMAPVGPFIRGTVPVPFHPPVMVTEGPPISFHPDEARAWNRWRFLIADCRWWDTDVHRNLR